MFREADADLSVLVRRRVAVLGYGNLGRPVALNLRDSGIPVLIGNIPDDYAKRAISEGFEVASIAEAARRSEILLVILPDEVTPEVYSGAISPSLKAGDMLVFASGYNVAFGYVEPPSFVDSVLIAPRTFGSGVREGYVNGQGFLSFLAVGQDATGNAWSLTLALAKALGSLRMGALELTFQQEAELDLFLQQAFLPALHNLLINAAEVLMQEGYPPEAALLDLYVGGELSYSLNKAAELGLMDTLRLNSLTAQYGMLSRADRFADTKLRRQMETTLDEIRSGKFAQEWTAEYANGYPRLESLRRKRGTLALWAMEQQAIATLRDSSADAERDSSILRP